MTDETGAAAPTDALPPQGVTESEQAKPEQTVPETGAAPDAETPQDGQQPTEESEDKPKKPTRFERMKRRMTAMATELDNLRAQIGTGEQRGAPEEGPKEADFNGDYFAYQAAKIAHESKKALRSEFDAERQNREQARLATLQREMVEDFEERAEEIRSRIPDFDGAIEAFTASGGKFSDALRDEILQSEMGPALAYQLAKNPKLANSLNAMSPREVAREIGRLEARASLPNPKRQTSAPAPMTQPKGGASPSRSETDLAKGEDVSELIAKWRASKK
jgi:hypothetical protein